MKLKIFFWGLILISIMTVLTNGPESLPIMADTNVLVSAEASLTVIKDSILDVSIKIGQVNDLNAAQYDIVFDSSKLQFDSISKGMIGETSVPVQYNKIAEGKYRVLNFIGLGSVSGSGTLAVIKFRTTGTGQAEIGLTGGILSALSGSAIPATWSGVVVTITDTGAVAPVSSSVSYTTTTTSAGTTSSVPVKPMTTTTQVISTSTNTNTVLSSTTGPRSSSEITSPKTVTGTGSTVAKVAGMGTISSVETTVTGGSSGEKGTQMTGSGTTGTYGSLSTGGQITFPVDGTTLVPITEINRPNWPVIGGLAAAGLLAFFILYKIIYAILRRE